MEIMKKRRSSVLSVVLAVFVIFAAGNAYSETACGYDIFITDTNGNPVPNVQIVCVGDLGMSVTARGYISETIIYGVDTPPFYVELTPLPPPPHVFIGSAYASGHNNTVEFYGLSNDEVCTYGYAICRGDWWIYPCDDWRSYCSTGWELDPGDFYTVPRQNCGWCGYDQW